MCHQLWDAAVHPVSVPISCRKQQQRLQAVAKERPVSPSVPPPKQGPQVSHVTGHVTGHVTWLYSTCPLCTPPASRPLWRCVWPWIGSGSSHRPGQGQGQAAKDQEACSGSPLRILLLLFPAPVHKAEQGQSEEAAKGLREKENSSGTSEAHLPTLTTHGCPSETSLSTPVFPLLGQ